MRRKTHEEYVAQLHKSNPHIHPISRYTNNRTKIWVEHDVCHHKWEVIPSTPLRGVGCPYCSGRKKRTYEEFINDLKKINPNIRILTEEQDYVDGSTKVYCECLIDGNRWWALPSSLLTGRGCPKCYGYIEEKEFVNMLSKKNNNIVLYGKYLGSKTPTLFKCLIDGNIWYSQPYKILHDVGCPKCKSRKQSERQILSHDEYLKRLQNITNDILPLEKYIQYNVPIAHVCLKCGHIWYVSPNSLITEHTGCPKCNCSKGENRIIKYLEDKNIYFIFQKSFDDLKYINSLYYDFYIPSQNILIEYDGEFHYMDIFHNGSYEESLIRDNIKTEYAKKNNIQLIRIPYWDFDNIEKILDEFKLM